MRALKLILLLALLIGMSAAAYSLLGRDGPFRREIGITPEETQQAAQAERTERVNPPAFDIVRVEETGEIVAAGTAPPGWTIHLETQQRVIGKVKTDFGGSWVFTPDAPLPEGEHSLGLRARRLMAPARSLHRSVLRSPCPGGVSRRSSLCRKRTSRRACCNPA